MSAGRQRSRAKYSTDPEIQRFKTVARPLTVYDHAIDQYRERLPDRAVPPAVAWERSERAFHPEALATHRHTPDEVRIYNHAGQYWAVFIVQDGAVRTVYNSTTHEHPPTRAYVRAHGPHYSERGDGDE